MHTVLLPEGWERPKGYANGIAARGTQIFVGGQIGWNAQQQFESDDFVLQTAQALRNVLAVLHVPRTCQRLYPLRGHSAGRQPCRVRRVKGANHLAAQKSPRCWHSAIAWQSSFRIKIIIFIN